jgi:ubiquinone/menaquinone biosynthesis C-methylase UbiE
MSDGEATPVPGPDIDAQRGKMLDRWGQAAAGWAKRADRVREFGMPVAAWMIEHAELQPGQQVVELAGGPGDTGFLAAELIQPGGTLISSDGTEEMLAVARQRAGELGIKNVEFKLLQLEWIDLPAAGVDVVLCRWGLMFCFDPAAALQEIRRVLRPGGRLAFAVWDEAASNPWATIPGAALFDQGLVAPPDPNAPGMFALASAERLHELIESAGFVEATVETVDVERCHARPEEFIEQTLDLSSDFARATEGLAQRSLEALREDIAARIEPFRSPDGAVRLPGRSLVAAASA